MSTHPGPVVLLLGSLAAFFVIYVAYRIGKVILRVFIGLAVLALLSWWLWSLFHS
ncbi:MAG TPA: hypothetical protein VJ486_04605 [Geothrix sp.]|nr:hypothetical protein [Geothrix sp.]